MLKRLIYLNICSSKDVVKLFETKIYIMYNQDGLQLVNYKILILVAYQLLAVPNLSCTVHLPYNPHWSIYHLTGRRNNNDKTTKKIDLWTRISRISFIWTPPTLKHCRLIVIKLDNVSNTFLTCRKHGQRILVHNVVV